MLVHKPVARLASHSLPRIVQPDVVLYRILTMVAGAVTAQSPTTVGTVRTRVLLGVGRARAVLAVVVVVKPGYAGCPTSCCFSYLG
jgi:hypothetical protein